MEQNMVSLEESQENDIQEIMSVIKVYCILN